MAATESIGKMCSKRIQFHSEYKKKNCGATLTNIGPILVDAATALPLPKHKAPIAYVSVKITDIKDSLKTSVVKGQMNPTWQQNLTPYVDPGHIPEKKRKDSQKLI
jgi:hypothetical protein